MAPAANDNAYDSIDSATFTANEPLITAIGSTIPLSIPVDI
jgi:hypothetical protein